MSLSPGDEGWGAVKCGKLSPGANIVYWRILSSAGHNRPGFGGQRRPGQVLRRKPVINHGVSLPGLPKGRMHGKEPRSVAVCAVFDMWQSSGRLLYMFC